MSNCVEEKLIQIMLSYRADIITKKNYKLEDYIKQIKDVTERDTLKKVGEWLMGIPELTGITYREIDQLKNGQWPGEVK